MSTLKVPTPFLLVCLLALALALIASAIRHREDPLVGPMDQKVCELANFARAHQDLGLGQTLGLPVRALDHSEFKASPGTPPGPALLLSFFVDLNRIESHSLRDVSLVLAFLALVALFFLYPQTSLTHRTVFAFVALGLPAYHFGATRLVPEVPTLAILTVSLLALRTTSCPSILRALLFFCGAFFSPAIGVLALGSVPVSRRLWHRTWVAALAPLGGFFLGTLVLMFMQGLQEGANSWSKVLPNFTGLFTPSANSHPPGWRSERWDDHINAILTWPWLLLGAAGTLLSILFPTRMKLPATFWLLTLGGAAHVAFHIEEVAHHAMTLALLAPSVAWASTHLLISSARWLQRWNLAPLSVCLAVFVLAPFGWRSSERLHRYQSPSAAGSLELALELAKYTSKGDAILIARAGYDPTLVWLSRRWLRFGVDRPRKIASLKAQAPWILVTQIQCDEPPFRGWARKKKRENVPQFDLDEYRLISLQDR